MKAPLGKVPGQGNSKKEKKKLTRRGTTIMKIKIYSFYLPFYRDFHVWRFLALTYAADPLD